MSAAHDCTREPKTEGRARWLAVDSREVGCAGSHGMQRLLRCPAAKSAWRRRGSAQRDSTVAVVGLRTLQFAATALDARAGAARDSGHVRPYACMYMADWQ